MIRLLSLVLACLLLMPSAMATTGVASAQNIQIGAQVIFGMQQQYPAPLFQYTEPTTTTAQFMGNTMVLIPANATNYAVSIATLFPSWATPVVVGFQEVTNPSLPLTFSLTSAGTTLQLAPTGFFMYRSNGGTPTFYFNNPSATAAAVVQVFGLSN